MSSTEPTAAEPPACERCGARTYPSTRKMLSHDISSGQAVPREKVVDVWRCPRCSREMPRT
jgi:hypothetical protein